LHSNWGQATVFIAGEIVSTTSISEDIRKTITMASHEQNSKGNDTDSRLVIITTWCISDQGVMLAFAAHEHSDGNLQ